ncbi:hypothetical protein ECTW09195_1710 [Escherichia coli TW09195]|nr:hypothetical protein ECTW09195_1710 [Escherichia coli TW09195]
MPYIHLVLLHLDLNQEALQQFYIQRYFQLEYRLCRDTI